MFSTTPLTIRTIPEVVLLIGRVNTSRMMLHVWSSVFIWIYLNRTVHSHQIFQPSNGKLDLFIRYGPRENISINSGYRRLKVILFRFQFSSISPTAFKCRISTNEITFNWSIKSIKNLKNPFFFCLFLKSGLEWINSNAIISIDGFTMFQKWFECHKMEFA